VDFPKVAPAILNDIASNQSKLKTSGRTSEWDILTEISQMKSSGANVKSFGNSFQPMPG